MSDTQMMEVLDHVVPASERGRPDWGEVLSLANADAAQLHRDLREAGDRSPLPVRRWSLRLGFVAAVVAVTAAVLAWPFQAEQGGVLDRALAAIGEGPVLHVVLRDEVGGTLVDLRSGERRRLYGENEVWYDSRRGVVHSLARLGNAVMSDDVSEPKEPPRHLRALGLDYRHALESGSAEIAGEGTVDGEPVVWVTIRTLMLPDVADGKDHEWAQQVAISRRTYKPVALRETRDGAPGPGTLQRVLELEMLPSGAGDFSAPVTDARPPAFSLRRQPIEEDQAAVTLGQQPLWLGRSHAGLALVQVLRETTRTGHQEDGVGKVVWDEERHGVGLFYGTVGDDPSTYRKDKVPRFDQPHVLITQTTHQSPARRGVGSYWPPEGSMLIEIGSRTGVLRLGRLHVTIDAANDQTLLAAARALEQMPN